MHCHLRPKRILLLGRTVLVAEPRKHFLQSLAMLLKHDGFEKKQIELLGMLSTFPDYFQPLVVAAFSKTWNCLHKTYWSFLIRNLSLFVYHLKINQKYCYPFQILHKKLSWKSTKITCYLKLVPDFDWFSIDCCACFLKNAKLSTESSSSSPWDPMIVLGREGDRQ